MLVDVVSVCGFEDFNRVPRAKGELGMLRSDTSIRLELVKDGRDIALVWNSDGTRIQEEQDTSGNWVTAGDVGDVEEAGVDEGGERGPRKGAVVLYEHGGGQVARFVVDRVAEFVVGTQGQFN